METFDQQEKRARQKMRPSAVVKAALAAGAITFVLPGGGPWMSYESGIATMGRVISESSIMAALWQVVLALAYGWVVASIMYSFSTLTGIVVGTLIGIPLYGVNYMILRNGMGFAGNELHTLISHLAYCLFFSSLYRGMAVRPPRPTQTPPATPTR